MSITNPVSKIGLHTKRGLHTPKLFALGGLGRIHITAWNARSKDAFQKRNYIVRSYDEALARLPIAR